MKPGQIIITPLLQSDGLPKSHPVLVLQELKPSGDLLVCGISTQLKQRVPGVDELIQRSDEDFSSSGLCEDSLIQLDSLTTIPSRNAKGDIGHVGETRLRRLLLQLASRLHPQSAPPGRILGVIPARYASTRFPGKPLALIAGKPLIQHVVEQCQKAKSLSEVIVATDDTRIFEVAQDFCQVEMTSPDHPSGSDRIAEIAERNECDAVINIQGDEPLIDPSVIDAVAKALDKNEMSTAATLIKEVSEYENPNVVKVVVNVSGHALYFSRRTIPFLRDAANRSAAEQLAAFPFLKHLGIYGYRRETLLRLVKFPQSPLEQAEKLEQLRALENGIQIAVVNVNYDSIGVDLPEDVARVEKILDK